LVASKNGYPRMMSSSPIFATRNLCSAQWFSHRRVRKTTSVISPCLFRVPSTLKSFLLFGSRLVGNRCFSTNRGLTRLSVAPLSSSASVSAFSPSVYNETRAFIALFVAIYTEFEAQARAIAVVLRPLENPSLLPSSLLSLRRHP